MVNKGRKYKVDNAGENSGQSDLTNEDAIFIFSSYETTLYLSELFGISTRSINQIRSGETGETVTCNLRMIPKCERDKVTDKLGRADVIAIYTSGEDTHTLVERYKVAKATINGIRAKRTRRKLTDSYDKLIKESI